MPQRVGLLTVGESVLDLSDQLHVHVRGWDGAGGLAGWASLACPRWLVGPHVSKGCQVGCQVAVYLRSETEMVDFVSFLVELERRFVFLAAHYYFIGFVHGSLLFPRIS